MYSFLQINMYIYIITDTIILGQLNKAHNVWLLNMMHYGNGWVFKINMRIPYQNSIARCVIVEYDATQKLYINKNEYAQFHIRTWAQAK